MAGAIFRFYDFILSFDGTEGPVFEVHIDVQGEAPDNLEVLSVKFKQEGMQPLEMTETQFVSLFPNAQDMINNAFEKVASIDLDI